MDRIVVSDIPFRVEVKDLYSSLRLAAESEEAGMIRRLAAAAEAVGRPQALYGVAYLEERGEDWVIIEGVRFVSRVMAVNLEPVHRVFPFVVSCGRELEEWSASITDGLERFLADAIKGQGLAAAVVALSRDLAERFQPGPISMMNPGSLQDWPIEEQRKLFTILGDTETAIGVKLLDTCFMAPKLTISGLAFPSEVNFQSCQLCPREKCPGRRAAYEMGLMEKKYQKK